MPNTNSELTISTEAPAISKFLEKNDTLAVLFNPEQLAVTVQSLEKKIEFHQAEANRLHIANRGCYFKVWEQQQKADANQHAGKSFAYREQLEELFASLTTKQRVEVEQIRAKLLIQRAKDAINENCAQRIASLQLAQGPTILDIQDVKIKK